MTNLSLYQKVFKKVEVTSQALSFCEKNNLKIVLREEFNLLHATKIVEVLATNQFYAAVKWWVVYGISGPPDKYKHSIKLEQIELQFWGS